MDYAGPHGLCFYNRLQGGTNYLIRAVSPVGACPIVERFSGRFRDEFLNENLFLNTEEAQKKLAEGRVHYNTKRPYSSLRNKTPEEFWLESEDGLTELVGYL